jgi:hypothetical protein
LLRKTLPQIGKIANITCQMVASQPIPLQTNPQMNLHPDSLRLSPSLDIPPAGFIDNPPLEVRANCNEHAIGVRVETNHGKARDYTKRSKEHFSEDARQLLFDYAGTSANGAKTGNSNALL